MLTLCQCQNWTVNQQSTTVPARIERVQALADISRWALCCHSKETRAQLDGNPAIPPTYIRVRAVVWECGEGQTHRHTDARDQYTVRIVYAKCNE